MSCRWDWRNGYIYIYIYAQVGGTTKRKNSSLVSQRVHKSWRNFRLFGRCETALKHRIESETGKWGTPLSLFLSLIRYLHHGLTFVECPPIDFERLDYSDGITGGGCSISLTGKGQNYDGHLILPCTHKRRGAPIKSPSKTIDRFSIFCPALKRSALLWKYKYYFVKIFSSTLL